MNTASCPWVLFIVMIVAAITVCYTDDNDLDNNGKTTKTALKTARSSPVSYPCSAVTERSLQQRRWRRKRASNRRMHYRLQVHTGLSEEAEARGNPLYVRAYDENGDTWDSWHYVPHTTSEDEEAFLKGACVYIDFPDKSLRHVKKLQVMYLGADGWGPGWMEVHYDAKKFQCVYPCHPVTGDCIINNGEIKDFDCCSESCFIDLPDAGQSNVDFPSSTPWDD